MVYEMQRNGGCTGAETGQVRSFRKGEKIQAPKGEFAHLPDSATRALEYEDRQVNAKPRYVVEDGGKGWYKVRDTQSGEYVGGESARDRSEADANAKRLNDAD